MRLRSYGKQVRLQRACKGKLGLFLFVLDRLEERLIRKIWKTVTWMVIEARKLSDAQHAKMARYAELVRSDLIYRNMLPKLSTVLNVGRPATGWHA